MCKTWRYSWYALFFLTAVITLITLLLPFWLLPVVQWFLPSGVTLQAPSQPKISGLQLTIPQLSLLGPDCTMAQTQKLRVGYRNKRLVIDANTLNINSGCLARWPQHSQQAASAPLSLRGIQQLVPALQIHIAKLMPQGWEDYSGQLNFSSQGRHQSLTYQAQLLQMSLQLDNHSLKIKQFTLTHPLFSQPVKISGEIAIADQLIAAPDQLNLDSTLQIAQYPRPLTVQLHWQPGQGLLRVQDAQQPEAPLLNLPLQLNPEGLQIKHGTWHWPIDDQSLNGQITLSISQWRQGINNIRWQGRVNVLSEGKGGRGNAVISFGPGKLGLVESQLPLQIYGTAKITALQFFAGLPGQVTGPITAPQLKFSPGALLRMRGRVLPGWQVDEVRLPLAGVHLGLSGVSGPLQAKFWIRNLPASYYRLYVSGQAEEFLPQHGRWRWRYWGVGKLLPLAAQWDVKGSGHWQKQTITLTSLSTGFNQIHYGKMRINNPRMSLKGPLIWSYDPQHPQFTGALEIAAHQTHFGNTSRLPSSHLRLQLKGTSPRQFNYQGELVAPPIGPVTVQGRRDDQHWLGRAWWPEQSLRVFQPLIGSTDDITLRDGRLRAQAAFSVTPKQGFQAGGHWLVQHGALWLPSLHLSGIDFSLPFRFFDQRWHFGWHQPVSLHIAELTSKIPLHNLHAELRGAWPWRRQDPLTLQAVSLELFGGEVRLPYLSVPQNQPATVQLNQIDTQQLVENLYPGQLKMQGTLSGALPIWFEPKGWRISDGWLSNDQPLRLNISQSVLQEKLRSQIAADTLGEWLSPLMLNQAKAKINVDNQGEMRLKAKIQATSQIDGHKQGLIINYQQQENILQLWRSINFSDNLRSKLEETLHLPQPSEDQK